MFIRFPVDNLREHRLGCARFPPVLPGRPSNDPGRHSPALAKRLGLKTAHAVCLRSGVQPS